MKYCTSRIGETNDHRPLIKREVECYTDDIMRDISMYIKFILFKFELKTSQISAAPRKYGRELSILADKFVLIKELALAIYQKIRLGS